MNNEEKKHKNVVKILEMLLHLMNSRLTFSQFAFLMRRLISESFSFLAQVDEMWKPFKYLDGLVFQYSPLTYSVWKSDIES